MNSPARRLLVVNKMYPPDIGGVETVTKQYAEWMAEAGLQVRVLCCRGRPGLRTLVERGPFGIEIIRVASLGTLFSLPMALGYPLRLLREARWADVIHFHEPFPLASGTAMMMPKRGRWLVTWHSDVVKSPVLRVAVEWVQRRLLRRADVITTTSPALGANSRMLQKYTAKIAVVPLTLTENADGVVAEQLSGVAIPSRFQLFLGRLSAYKGIDVLMEALQRIDDPAFRLVIAGAGDKAALVRAHAGQQASRLVFIDRVVTEAEKVWLLRHCEAFVMPSTLPSEAFGIMQLEAMREERPVINTALPTGVPWVSLHGETGLTVAPGDPVGLAGAMQRLWSDAELRVALGRGARNRFDAVFASGPIRQRLLALLHGECAT